MKTINDIYSKFEWRDPICVSHYPFPKEVLQQNEIQKYIKIEQSSNLPSEKALYIHIPFCDKICSFCPFNKTLKNKQEVSAYIVALKQELFYYANSDYGKSIILGSVYMGGGTPSCLTKEQLIDIIEYVKKYFHISQSAQISIEGSPFNFSFDKLQAIFEIGVNRVSFGIQTFNPKMRENIQLSQTVQQNFDAILNAQKVGFKNICIDLLYNLPGQTMSEWEEDVKTAISLNIDHITIFSLCLVPGTILEHLVTKGIVPVPRSQNEEIDMFIKARKLLLDAGYEQYSIWDFAKTGKVDKHVQIYYQNQDDLIGTGAAAFGFINHFMYINKGEISEYIDANKNKQLPILVGKKSSKEDLMRGMIAKSLRLITLDKIKFRELFGSNPEEIYPNEFSSLEDNSLIEISEDSIKITPDGSVWGNNICKVFFEENETFEWRASLAKGKLPEISQEQIDLNKKDILEFDKDVEKLLGRILERKPMFIREHSRKNIITIASDIALARGKSIIQDEDIIMATIKDTPAPFRPMAISGFRKWGFDIDKITKSSS